MIKDYPMIGRLQFLCLSGVVFIVYGLAGWRQQMRADAQPPHPGVVEFAPNSPKQVVRSGAVSVRGFRTHGDVIDARCIEVTDGDTVKVEIAGLGYPWSPIQVRLLGIDTPELKDDRANVAAKAAAAKSRLAKLCSGPIVLTNVRRDKYFRLGAKITCRGKDVGSVMLNEGYAKPYSGLGPKPW